VCKATASSCTPGCKAGLACLAGSCVDALGTPAAAEPEGTGLYARLLRGSDTYLLFRDQVAGAVKVASGSDWKVSTLAGGDGKVDVGQGIGAAISSDGTVHVAYGDASHQVRYQTLKGGQAGPVQLIDDGARTIGTTPEEHWVGGGIVLFLDSDQPVVAYQDQTAGSLESARRGAMAWTHQTQSPGGSRSRGSYPQAVSKDGKWLLLDVVYDRAADALSTVGFSPL
jgi:hypothetical protein